MATPIAKHPITKAEASLEANIAWLREQQARLREEQGDLDAYADRFAEEMFGTPAAAAVLIEYVLRATGDLEPNDDSDSASDGW